MFTSNQPLSRLLLQIFSGTLLQQVFVVEYVVNNQMCETCHRREANDNWNAVAQVRQKVPHKKTFFYLEQLMIKHRAHTKTIKVKATPGKFNSSQSPRVGLVDWIKGLVLPGCRLLISGVVVVGQMVLISSSPAGKMPSICATSWAPLSQ